MPPYNMPMARRVAFVSYRPRDDPEQTQAPGPLVLDALYSLSLQGLATWVVLAENAHSSIGQPIRTSSHFELWSKRQSVLEDLDLRPPLMV